MQRLFAGLVTAFLFLLRKNDRTESLLSALPTLTCKLLHVDCLVVLVDDFQTEDSLDYVLEGYDTLETAVFIDDESHLLMLLEQFLPDMSAGIFLLEIGYRAFQFYQSLVEFVICETSRASLKRIYPVMYSGESP